MNLVEAVKYGGNIRNLKNEAECCRVWHNPDKMYYDLPDLQSDTWEAEEMIGTEKSIVITTSQFYAACNEYAREAGLLRDTRPDARGQGFWFSSVAQRLGLE